MATLGFTDNDGVDLGNKFVTKEYVMDWYPDLVPNMLTPQLRTWGNDGYGRLGNNIPGNKSSPTTTAGGGTNWKQVAIGRTHGAAIKTNGTLWAWGYNSSGPVGDNTQFTRNSPVTTAGGGTNWKQVACGYRHTAAVKTDGTLWLCGYNNSGQLGINVVNARSSPVTTITGGTNWKQVACGSLLTAAVKTDGTLWTWGYNAYGQLGDNTTGNKSSPVTTITGGTNWKQVACGSDHAAAIKTDGTLWSWGSNLYGAIGDNTTVDKSSPVTTIAGGTNWKQVACGERYTAAIKTDGTLWSWGAGSSGKLGDNTAGNKSSPVTTIAGGTNWKQVACGTKHTAAVKTDGTLWAWGNDSYGELGDNTAVNKASPVTTIAGGTNWKQVACGYNFTAAISESEGW